MTQCLIIASDVIDQTIIWRSSNAKKYKFGVGEIILVGNLK
jgi:hypothetical protein